MFDFGFWELTVVVIVALIVVGPERLPIVAAKFGRWVGKVRRYVQTVRSDIESEIKAAELKEILQKQQGEIQELRNMLQDATPDTTLQASTRNEEDLIEDDHTIEQPKEAESVTASEAVDEQTPRN